MEFWVNIVTIMITVPVLVWMFCLYLTRDE
jgi:hypothetical protein